MSGNGSHGEPSKKRKLVEDAVDSDLDLITIPEQAHEVSLNTETLNKLLEDIKDIKETVDYLKKQTERMKTPQPELNTRLVESRLSEEHPESFERDDDGFEADQGNVALVDHPRSSTESKESHLSLYINHKEEKETIVTIIMYFQDKEKFNADFEIYVPRFKDHKILSQLMGFPEKQDLDETKEELMEFVKRRIERGPEELELRSLYPTLRELLNGNVLQYVQGDVKFLHKKFDSGKQENTWHFDVEKEYLAAIKHLQNQFRKARLNWYFKIRTDRVKPRNVLEDKLQKYMEKMIVAENVYVPKFKESKFFKEMTERHSNCESDSLYGAALGIHYEFLSNNVEKEDKILDYDFDYLSNLEVPQKERAEVQYFKNLFHYDFASISLYI